VAVAGEATPGIQLAGFDDLLKLATGSSASLGDGMQERSDRSLANTFPFNMSPDQNSRNSFSSRQRNPDKFRQNRRDKSVGAAVIAARTSHVQNYLQSSRTPNQGSPASTFVLDPKSQNQVNNGFTLLAGLGTQADLKQVIDNTPNSLSYQKQTQNIDQNIGNDPRQLNFSPNDVPNQSLSPFRPQQPAQIINQGLGNTPTQPGFNFLTLPFNSLAPSNYLASGFSSFPSNALEPAFTLQDFNPNIDVPSIRVPNDPFIFQEDTPTRRPAPVQRPAPTRRPALVQRPAPGRRPALARRPAPAQRPATARRPAPSRRPTIARRPPQPQSFVNPSRRRNPAQRRRKPAGQTFDDVAAAGQRCIDKIEQVEEIEYDDVEECEHSYDKKCHTSYSTEYESQQEEECDDNYKKDCQITYSPQANNVTVTVCMTPLVKDCSIAGPEVCRVEYVSECWTKNDPHVVSDDVPKCRTEYEEKCVEKQSGYVTEEKCSKWPKEVCTVARELKTKFNPVTACEKVPQELCGPAGCGFVPGVEECHDDVKTVVTDVPSEVCDLQPQRKCAYVTKLVPKLTPVEECVDVPKEVCQRKKGNPRTVYKPVTKTWCYTPTEESGLA